MMAYYARIVDADRVRQDLHDLPAKLDHADALFEASVVGTAERNAADCPILAYLRMLMAHERAQRAGRHRGERPGCGHRPQREPAARLVAFRVEHPPVRLEVSAGQIGLGDDFDAPLDDFAPYA